MDESRVEWLADGFRVRFDVRPLPPWMARHPELTLLYAVFAVAVVAGLHPALGALLLVPVVGLGWAMRTHDAALEVTHDHLIATAPLRPTMRLDLREVREVEVFESELELQLWGGRRLRVASPAPGRQLQWVVSRIRELRDESQAFALEMAERDEVAQLKRLLPVRS